MVERMHTHDSGGLPSGELRDDRSSRIERQGDGTEMPIHPRDSEVKVEERAERPLRAGVFATVPQADQVIQHLLSAGFGADEITVICSENADKRHFSEFQHQQPAGTYTPLAATTGAVIGAAVGGVAAVAGVLTTGGIGVLASAGLATWSGGVVGGLIGAMMTRGVERELANFYDQAVTEGKIVVAVEAKGGDRFTRLNHADKIIADGGAEPMPLPKG